VWVAALVLLAQVVALVAEVVGQFGQYTTSGGVIENTAGYAGAAGGGTGLFGQGSSGAGGAGMSTPFDSVSYATWWWGRLIRYYWQ